MDVFVFATVVFFFTTIAFFAGIYFGSDDSWNGPWRADDDTVDLVDGLTGHARTTGRDDLVGVAAEWADHHRPRHVQAVAKVRAARPKPRPQPRPKPRPEPTEFVLGPPQRQPAKPRPANAKTKAKPAQVDRPRTKQRPSPKTRQPARRPTRRSQVAR